MVLDIDIIGLFNDAYQRILKGGNNYAIDDAVAARFSNCADVMSRFCKRNPGRLKELDVTPQFRDGTVWFWFRDLTLDGDELKDFADMVHDSDGVSVEYNTEGGIEIAITYKGLFKKTK